MSVLDLPRIHFQGFSRVNVPTGNRNVCENIDIATNTVFMNGEAFDLSKKPDEYHQYLRSLPPHFDKNGLPDADGIFNQSTGYNFGGNNHISWDNVKIVSVQNRVAQHDFKDSIVGGQVALWGHYNAYLRTSFNRARWVDNDPNDPQSSQIYAGQITIGARGATATCPNAFSSDFDCVHSARWLTTDRILSQSEHFLNSEFGRSRVFQFSVPKDSEFFQFNEEVVRSPCLEGFKEALKDENVLGLTIQYSLFNMSTPLTPDSAVFYDLVGTIGLWKKQELATYPSGRLLTSKTIGFGPLSLKLNDGWVSFNMPTSLPFSTRSQTALSEKHPTHQLGEIPRLGTLELKTEDGLVIASIPENIYLDYWCHSGIFDILISADKKNMYDQSSLVLTCQLGDWIESDWVVQSDAAYIALEAPDHYNNTVFSEQVDICSYYRGIPKSKSGLTFNIDEQSIVEVKSVPGQAAPQEGLTPVSITSMKPGSTRIHLDGTNNSIGVRVLPDDWELANVPVEDVDYPFLYEKVMAYYELVYPFMADKVFSLADQCKCETHAKLMWQMCDPENRDKSFYMPSTRELSYPKSMLFLKFLKNIGTAALPEIDSNETKIKLSRKKQLITSSASTDAVDKIDTKEKLVSALKKAVSLELSIMLQYVYAAYSIPSYAAGEQKAKNGQWTEEQLKMACGGSDFRLDSGWRGTLIEIAHEEMIHYLIINNLLMSLGEPFFVGETLIGQQAQEVFGFDTEFAFEPFSENVLARFIRFEWPDYVPSPSKSIADFYVAIRQSLIDIPNLFESTPSKSGGEHHLFLNELTNRSHPGYQMEINSLESALFAIDFVTEQGEGVSPTSPHFEDSHFCRMREIANVLANQKIPFEPAMPVIKNAVLKDSPGCTTVIAPEARAIMKLYDGCYDLMIQMMIQHFGYRPLSSLRRSRLMNGSIDIMTGLLRPLSAMIMSLPSGIPGRNAAPPVPLNKNNNLIQDHFGSCEVMANMCCSLSEEARMLETKLPLETQIKMLDFFEKQLGELASGIISLEA